MSKLRNKTLKTASAWLFALALLIWVWFRIEPELVWQALQNASWKRYLGIATLFTLIWFIYDSFVLSRLVSRFQRKISTQEILPLRGASYLFMVFSYDAAQAALALALSRRFSISLVAMGGTFLFYYLNDLLTITTLSLVASASLDHPIAKLVAPSVAIAFLAILVLIGTLTLWSRAPEAKIPARLRGTQLLATLRSVRLRDFLEFMLYRGGFYASFIAFTALALPCFGITIPLHALIAFVPIVMSISALPITVSGLGSTQVLMLALYAPFADEAAIVAYSVVYSATLLFFRLPIGILFFGHAAKKTFHNAESALPNQGETK